MANHVWRHFSGIHAQRVYNLRDKISSDDIVVISFGVSPFISPDIIDDGIRAAKEHGNAISVEDFPLCTCIKDDEEVATQNLIRNTIKEFSNPWTFRYGDWSKLMMRQ